MNQNKKDKVKDFFRKEGFYFVLFLCLCVVAMVAAFTMKNNNTETKTNKPKEEFTLNIEDKDNSQSTSKVDKQNADRVENNTDKVASNEGTEVAQEPATEPSNEVAFDDQTTPVSTDSNNVTFMLPVEGTVARDFGTMVRVKETQQGATDMTRRGVDVTAAVGTVVKAAADGKVTEVSSSPEDGNYIVIAHTNGLKTKYSNLDPEVNVAVGDNVVAGDEIGKIGNTSLIFTSQLCGDVLNLQVEDANGSQVNPTSYFNFQ